MQRAGHIRAFTLVELMVGLMVTSILLSAVATLAFAMSSASAACDDAASCQAQLRQATVRLSELIANCKMICAAPGTDLVVWNADANGNGLINVNELVYVERGSAYTLLRLRRFYSATNPTRTIAQLALTTTKTQLLNLCTTSTTSLIPDCNDVQFKLLNGVQPPRTQSLAITFGLTEDGAYQRHEIVAGLRCRSDYLLTSSNAIITTGDDD
ncbi:MAG: PilW family protein [Solirubrobacterales bacterium]